MPTKTAYKWKEKPGGYDTVGTEEFLLTDNDWGFPYIRRSPAVMQQPPDFMLDYKNARTIDPRSKSLEKAGIHFYIDDYRFESLWTQRKIRLGPIKKFHTMFTPDFSLYTDWPKAVNIWNTYRSRWLGAYWQKHGVERIVPTIGWSDETSYEYCFKGIEQGSTVSVATLGIIKDDEVAWASFRRGYEEMIRQIKPEMVLAYGPLPPWVHLYSAVRCYPTKWDLLHPNKRMRDDVYRLGKQVKAEKSFMPIPVALAEGEKQLYNQDSDNYFRKKAKERKIAQQGWAQTSLLSMLEDSSLLQTEAETHVLVTR